MTHFAFDESEPTAGTLVTSVLSWSHLSQLFLVLKALLLSLRFQFRPRPL